MNYGSFGTRSGSTTLVPVPVPAKNVSDSTQGKYAIIFYLKIILFYSFLTVLLKEGEFRLARVFIKLS
jgi:hypothetical protein